MNNLLLVEKSHVKIDSSSTDKYVLEGIFTELGSENRNGRVYTKQGFLPHMKLLSSIIEQGKCLGELDHPKVFETSLKNSSHVIEKIWFNEEENKVYGRIKLLDTDAGKQAKALVDAGVPLHISSRAAGTVKEDKSVDIHKLFTYDLVADPGFENAVMHTVNESYGFTQEESRHFLIFDVNESSSPAIKTAAPVSGPVELSGYIKESEMQEFSKVSNEQIEVLKEQIKDLVKSQEAIIKHNDEIVDNDSSEEVSERLLKIENWSKHVVDEFNGIKPSEEILEQLDAINKWSIHVTESVTAVEAWSDEVTESVTAVEAWSDEVTETVSLIEKWSDEATETVSLIEKWSDEATESVSIIEKWTDGATTTITGLEEWTAEATESITILENAKPSAEQIKAEETQKEQELIKETEDADAKSFISDIYTKIDAITSDASKQKANEDKESILEANEIATQNEPIWMSKQPAKYGELWEALSDAKKNSITKRANLCEFGTEHSITEFWDSTFSGVNLESIKEAAPITSTVEEVEQINEAAELRKQKYIENYNSTFGNKY